jgi:RNA polymerase II subunit A-like phosphatase
MDQSAPGAEMLEDLKSTFTMYIYTMGTKAYAEEVKKILDPCGVIFGKRVLSRCDTPDLNIKLLSKLKLADTDTHSGRYSRVWSEHRRNLLQIDRYTFFPLRADELCFFSEEG